MATFGQLKNINKILYTFIASCNFTVYNAILYKFLRLINLNFVPNKYQEPIDRSKCKIIIITGSPRSGSTLLNQVLINCLDLNYYSNFNYSFPHLNSNNNRHIRSNTVSYNSYFGHTRGLFEPNEGNHIFDAVKKHGINILFNQLDTTRCIDNDYYIFKNIRNYSSIPSIIKDNNNIHLIWCTRDIFFNIQSSFLAYKRLRSFHPIPDELLDVPIHNDPLLFATKQIYFINKHLHLDTKDISEDKFITIHYEELCENITKQLFKISNTFDVPIVSKLPFLNNLNRIRLSNDDVRKINNELIRLSTKYNYFPVGL
jgi:hypothetical protein